MDDYEAQERAYRTAVEDLRLSHNQWRGMMRLTLWVSVLGMLFARLNDSRAALIVAVTGFIAGIVCFSKVWLTRRQMRRLVQSKPTPPPDEVSDGEATSVDEDPSSSR